MLCNVRCPRVSAPQTVRAFDRGFASLEVVLYVLALKAIAPATVHLLRGNHELPVCARAGGSRGFFVCLRLPKRLCLCIVI